jgi:hypothetical protein
MLDPLKCSDYVNIRCKMNNMDSQTDELIGLAKNRIDNEARINQLQKDRWSLLTFTMSNGKVRFIITDQEKLDNNLLGEMQLQENLTKLDAKFMSLDTVFADLMQQLPEFIKPCISELKAFKMNLSNERFIVEGKLRKEAAFVLDSTRAKGQSLDNILADPKFQDYKLGAETRMKNLDDKIKICESFIEQINEIIK